MKIKKLVPWNWFKKEENAGATTIPVRRSDAIDSRHTDFRADTGFHGDMDRFFDDMINRFGWLPSPFEFPSRSRAGEALLKPMLDLGATDTEYTINVEIPGVSKDDVTLEIGNDTLTIRGEKKHSVEEKDKGFYRIERSYGSFQRVLSLPEDVDQDDVNASFKDGVLTITLPRKESSTSETKRIAVQAA